MKKTRKKTAPETNIPLPITPVREVSSVQENYTRANQVCVAGIRAYQEGNRVEAIRLWHQALEIHPDFEAAIMNLGVAYREEVGRLDFAIELFRKALAIRPDFPEALYNLALSMHLFGRFTEAAPYYLRTIRQRPEFADAHTNLDLLLHEHIKNPELTISCYRQLWRDNPHIDQVGPRRIRLETASACNLRCQHCPTGTNYGGTTRGVMTVELFEQALKQMKAMPILREVVLYLGGEPLLNRNLALMCRRVKEETSVTLMFFNTNAMLVDERICRELADARVDKIHVSIDGRSPEENDYIRQGANYQTIVNKVRMLQEHLVDTQIVIVNTIIRRGDDPDEPMPPAFLRRDFPDLPIGTNYAMQWPGLQIDRSALPQLNVAHSGRVERFCTMPFTQLAVRFNGDVTLCCYDLLGRKVMGNVQRETLMDIWQRKDYKEIRNIMLAREVSRLPEVCQGCVQYRGGMLVDASQR